MYCTLASNEGISFSTVHSMCRGVRIVSCVYVCVCGRPRARVYVCACVRASGRTVRFCVSILFHAIVSQGFQRLYSRPQTTGDENRDSSIITWLYLQISGTCTTCSTRNPKPRCTTSAVNCYWIRWGYFLVTFDMLSLIIIICFPMKES